MYMYKLVLVKYGRFPFNGSLAMKPISEKLPELRKAKGWSRDRLSHEAFNIDQIGTSSQQITSIELGRRPASARTMAALAEALGVEPTVFIEYRLALARHVLDEERVGLDEAAGYLEASGLEPIDVTLEEIKEHSHRRRKTVDRAQEIAEETVQRVQPKRRSP
jgi:transcriptional regulator with XRE-family HTH domain